MKKYPTALILGLAASGEAAARLLLAEGSKVWIADLQDGEVQRQRAAQLEALGAMVSLGRPELPAGVYSICIVSPGIPVHSAWVMALRRRGVPVISELELGWSRASCPVLAISGSNGKSTLVKLCADALRCAGHRVAIAGNYGPPVSRVVREAEPYDWLVLEVSSFQLETVRAFRPAVAVLLNLYPNHLDRHGDMARYQGLKTRLFRCLQAEDSGVLPDTLAADLSGRLASPNRWLTFGATSAADVCYQAGRLTNRLSSQKISLADTLMANEVLGLTAAAAGAALTACGVSMTALQEALHAFQPLAHRMQTVAIHRQVRFVDDSKATNLAALLAALKMSSAPVRLITGGQPKGESYAEARPLLAEKVAAVYLIGSAADTMAAAWQDIVACHLSRTLEQAFQLAWTQAQPGDTILLSPAYASFDQFKDFEERGARFAAAVQVLVEKT